MTAILYGNVRVEIISDIGALVQRVGLTRPQLTYSASATLRHSGIT
jgi:hypothetical protein